VKSMEANKRIASYRDQVNSRLRELMENDVQPESLYVPMRYVLEGDGKRVRPILLLLVNELFHGNKTHAMDVAVSLEILHNFTLVHDDIMDQDHQRRGRPTVHTKWDVGTGILSGDGLLALAYKVLTEVNTPAILRILRLFTQGILEICEGQAFDKEFESRADVEIDEYLIMIEKKTARLIAMACQMGGLVSGVSEERLSQLNQFGLDLGQAFQIQDDLLEMTSTMEVMGKSLGSDLFARKKTYVLIKARQMADQSLRNQIDDLVENNSHSEEDFEHVKRLIAETGVIEATQKTVKERIDSALAILDQFEGNVSHLKQFTLQLLQRKS